ARVPANLRGTAPSRKSRWCSRASPPRGRAAGRASIRRLGSLALAHSSRLVLTSHRPFVQSASFLQSPRRQFPQLFEMTSTNKRFDCIVIGGGHNGLVAAAY